MVKMILTVPLGFDAVKLLNVASELYRGRYGSDYDVDLGDFASRRLERVKRVTVHEIDGKLVERADYYDAYEVDGELVDFRMVAILDELEGLCPQVGKHFEQEGGGETYASHGSRFRDLGYIEIDVLEGDIDDAALAHMYWEG